LAGAAYGAKSKVNIAYCDGGLGNRFASLLFAYATQRKNSVPWVIAWPKNNWCGASFDALFDSDLKWNDTEITAYSRFSSDYTFMLHENPSGAITGDIYDQKNLASYGDLSRILSLGRPVFYAANLIPPFMSSVDFVDLEAVIRPSGKTLESVKDFLRGQDVNNQVKGLHIRMTDFRSNLNLDDLFMKVANSPNQRYFLCTDSQAANDRFSSLANCITYPKTDYPQKLRSDLDWNGLIEDSSGRRFPFNVNRNEAAVINGWIDLLILSMTNIIQTSNSTFLSLAQILKNVDYTRRCCV
jgi:hypothetical protein